MANNITYVIKRTRGDEPKKIHYVDVDDNGNLDESTYCGVSSPFEETSKITYRDRMENKVCKKCFKKYISSQRLESEFEKEE
jgi:hypothetical protein